MRTVLFSLLLLFFFAVQAAIVERVVWKAPVPIEEYRRLIKVHTGDELSVGSVRRTVRLLYATGRFEQVIVTMAPGTKEDQVILTISAQPVLLVEDIVISGNRALSDNRIKLVANLRRYAPFLELSLDRVREEIVFAYRSEGYFDAAVSIEVRRTSAATAELHISVQEGERRQITRVQVEGDIFPSEKRELENMLTFSDAFSPLTEERLRDMNDRVEEYYRNRGYLDVSVKRVTQDDGTVIMTVNRGPRYRLVFEGNVAFSDNTLREVVTRREQWHHDREETRKRLFRFYQAAGFPDVRVTLTVTEDRKENEVSTVATVEEGARRFLDGVVFSGLVEGSPREIERDLFAFVEERLADEGFPDPVLNRTLLGGGYRDTDGTRITTLRRTNRDRAVLPASRYAIPEDYTMDIARHIESLCRSQGFLEAKVERVALVREADLLYLDISLEEGPRTTLAWVGFRSGDPRLDEELESEMDIATEVPFDPAMVERTAADIEFFLRSRGYLFARVRPEQVTDGSRVRITFFVEDIFPVTAGEIVVSGNALTSESVVRSVVRIEQGSLITTQMLHDARQNLLITGAFDATEIRILDEDTPASEKDIVVSVTEAWRFRFDLGAGVATDEGVRLFGAFEYKNILGKVLTLQLSYKLAYKIPWFMSAGFRDYFLHEIASFERIDRSVNGVFIVPDLYFLPFSLGLQTELFHIHDTRSASGVPYLLDKNGLTFTLYKRFGDHFFLSLDAELSRQDEEMFHADLSGDDRFARAGRYLLSPGIEGWVDYRNSPVNSYQGWKIGLRLRNVTSLLGTETKYTLLENYLSGYLPLRYQRTVSGDYEPRDTLVWHSFLRYAALFLHTGTLTADDTLKLGGSTTVRGFGQNTIIPNDDDDGVPEGRYSIFWRNEMRVKIGDRLYVVAFFDAGNLWERIENVGKGDLFRYGAGGGLLFASPIGAVNLQAGANLFPREDAMRDYKEDLWSFHLFISSF